MTPEFGEWDDRGSPKAGRDRIITGCYVWMAVSAAAVGKATTAAAFLLAAAATRSCDRGFERLAHAALCLESVSAGRVFGALGYVAFLLGAHAVAHQALALHYGLIAIDSSRGLDSAAAGALALRFAL